MLPARPIREKEILGRLRDSFKNKTVVLGIGNLMRHDDAAGSLLAAALKGKGGFEVFDAGPSPENYLGKLILMKPAAVIIIDAADFRGRPGEYRLLAAADLKSTRLFSTHDSSLELVMNYLQKNLALDIMILAIQPEDVSFGEGLSPEVAGTVTQLQEWFCAAGKKEG